MNDPEREFCKTQMRIERESVSIPPPLVPDLEGDSLDLKKLGARNLMTYIKYDGLAIGDELWPQFFGCGSAGEVVDRERTPVTVQQLEPDGSFKVDVQNSLLVKLGGGAAFYSYAKTLITHVGRAEQRAEVQSDRLLFYVDKPVLPSEQVAVPHVEHSDGLVIDRSRLTGDIAIVVGAFPAMAVGDEVTLNWEDAGYSETFVKTLGEEDVGKPLTWFLDNSYLDLAGDWCEISYQVVYASIKFEDRTSFSPVQRLSIVKNGSPQLPSLPPPKAQGDSGGQLDPNDFPEGLVIEVPGDGTQYADEVLLRAVGVDTQRVSARLDRTLVDSGRVLMSVPPQWLQANVGQTVSITYQWARPGAAADSAPLQLTLVKPLNLKLPVIDGVTPQDPQPPEQPDPEIEQYGFIKPIRLITGAFVQIPVDTETGGGKVTMCWDGYGERGKYSTATPVIGNNLRYAIPASVVPANLGRRVKVYYTVERPGGTAQRSLIYGLKIEDWESSDFEPVQCPDAPDGKLSLQAVRGEVTFTLSSDSWRLFDEGQIVRVWVTGQPKPEHSPLPAEVIRDSVAVSEDEYYEGQLIMKLSKGYLEKLQEGSVFEVYASVSFDAGDSFKSIVPADILLQK